MVSILKVDTIKKTNDSVPTVADLGISTTGLGPNILQVVSSGIVNSQFSTTLVRE